MLISVHRHCLDLACILCDAAPPRTACTPLAARWRGGRFDVVAGAPLALRGCCSRGQPLLLTSLHARPPLLCCWGGCRCGRRRAAWLRLAPRMLRCQLACWQAALAALLLVIAVLAFLRHSWQAARASAGQHERAATARRPLLLLTGALRQRGCSAGRARCQPPAARAGALLCSLGSRRRPASATQQACQLQALLVHLGHVLVVPPPLLRLHLVQQPAGIGWAGGQAAAGSRAVSSHWHCWCRRGLPTMLFLPPQKSRPAWPHRQATRLKLSFSRSRCDSRQYSRTAAAAATAARRTTHFTSSCSTGPVEVASASQPGSGMLATSCA